MRTRKCWREYFDTAFYFYPSGLPSRTRDSLRTWTMSLPSDWGLPEDRRCTPHLRLGAPQRLGVVLLVVPSPKLSAHPCTRWHSRDWLFNPSFGMQVAGIENFSLSWILVNSSDCRCCFFRLFFSKVHLGFRFPKRCWDFVGREIFDIFSWMRCWEICCCLLLKETIPSISGLLHSELLFVVMLSRGSGESEAWGVDSGEVSTEVKGWKGKQSKMRLWKATPSYAILDLNKTD